MGTMPAILERTPPYTWKDVDHGVHVQTLP